MSVRVVTLFALVALFMVAEGGPHSRQNSSEVFMVVEDEPYSRQNSSEMLMVVEGGPHSRQNSSEVCYEDLGCFSNLPPHDHTDDVLPEDPDIIQTAFRLFTETCKNGSVLRTADVHALLDCGFDSTLSIKIIVHGFNANGSLPWIRDMGSALLQKEHLAVITVDWGNGAGFPYGQAVANARVVGAEIARLINFLRAYQNASVDKVHIIGHSLGAHIAGYTGQEVPGIARITGLDPAGFYFTDTDDAVHLDSSDANFVDIIHTDDLLGWNSQLGHVDFYPNGGDDQPGCGYFSSACSHSRSIYLFTESIISSCHFNGYPCDSLKALDSNTHNCLRCPGGICPKMGYWADTTSTRGKFYLRTMENTPYCGHTLNVQIEFGNMSSTKGEVRVEVVGRDQSTQIAIFNSRTFISGGGGQYGRIKVYRETITITDVIEVRVTFVQARESLTSRFWSYWHWYWYGSSDNTTSHFFSVSKVTVTSGEDGRSIHFCGDDQVVSNGNPISLTRSSTDPNECLPTIFNTH